MDSSEAGRILPNPRQRGRASSGQSSEVNSAEKEESLYGRNLFELSSSAVRLTDYHVPHVPATSSGASFFEASVCEKATRHVTAVSDFASQFLNLTPSTSAPLTNPASSVASSQSSNAILNEVVTLLANTASLEHHCASDSEESDSAQTATDELAPSQCYVPHSGSRDSCQVQLDCPSSIICPELNEGYPNRDLQERRKEKKRYVDRERKRYLRKTDKEYLEADRDKAKLRMRMKRQDPQYRQREKDRNREHKRKSRAESKRKEQDPVMLQERPKRELQMDMGASYIQPEHTEAVDRFPAAHCFMENITSPLEMIPERLVSFPSFGGMSSTGDLRTFGDPSTYSLFPYTADMHPSLEPSLALDGRDSA